MHASRIAMAGAMPPLGAFSLTGCGGSSSGQTGCAPTDSDGVIGGSQTFDLTVNDTAFSAGFAPDGGALLAPVLKAQNLASITLTLFNVGSMPHDFTVQCLPTPNSNGCPQTSCFPAGSSIPAVAPGSNATTTFVTPRTEGIYTFLSDLPGDTQPASDGGLSGLVGQFIVQ
jgi:hypothetical protein